MYSDEVIYLWRLLQPSNQYRRHKCRYWCQCKSAGSGSFAILLTCFVWMEMLIQLWRQKFRVGTNSGSWYHCLPIGIFHFLLRSGRTVLTMTGFARFLQEIWHRWLRRGQLLPKKIGCTSVQGWSLWAHTWNITEIFFLYTLFRNSPTGHNVRHIFTLDGWNDVDSRKDVPFGSFVDTASYFGGQIPPKPQFWSQK